MQSPISALSTQDAANYALLFFVPGIVLVAIVAVSVNSKAATLFAKALGMIVKTYLDRRKGK